MPPAIAPPAIAFANTFARLPERFYARVPPTPVAAPALIRVNEALARELGIDPGWLASPEGVAVLAGNRVPEGAEPLAAAYAGHQFGGFSPRLGDGRAVLLGEVVGRDGRAYDLQLKGAGRTPYSRGGDGRAALGPVLREYLVSEAMGALGVPTTRALAAVTTGEAVRREEDLPGAVLARVASSHLRIGSFEYFAARGDAEGLARLADYAVERHVPEARGAERPALALLEHVVAAQADLVARWLCLGFVHGVMNTDNAAISGETIDYGPCAFLDAYDPGAVFSAIDRGGRYAYAEQPRIAHWNLSRLAVALLPLLGADEAAGVGAATAALDRFAPRFTAAYRAGLRAKVGLPEDGGPEDDAMVDDLLEAMALGRADFTLTFRRLADAAADEGADDALRALFAEPGTLDAWLPRWRARLAASPGDGAARRGAMRRVNPAVVPRHHAVERVIAAARDGDLAPFHAMVEGLAAPYEDADPAAPWAGPPGAQEPPTRTFCGT